MPVVGSIISPDVTCPKETPKIHVKSPELFILVLRLGLVLVLGEQLYEISVLLGTTNKQANALSRCFGMYDHAEHGSFASKLLIPLHSSFVVAGFAE